MTFTHGSDSPVFNNLQKSLSRLKVNSLFSWKFRKSFLPQDTKIFYP